MDLSLNSGDLKVPLIGGDDNDVIVFDEERGEADSTNTAPHRGSAKGKHSIGFGALVFLIYYNIGVPFGDEQVTAALCCKYTVSADSTTTIFV